MNRERWLDELTSQMFRAGLPTDYIARSCLELSDHVVESERHGKDKRCGAEDCAVLSAEPKELASQFISTFRASTWYGRLPSPVWFLAPVVVSLGVCLAFYCSILITLDAVFDAASPSDQPWNPGFMMWFFYTGKLVTPVIATFLLLRMTFSAGVVGWLKGTSIVLLALMFAITCTDFQLPTATTPGTFRLMIEMSDSVGSLSGVVWQLAQAMVVLVIGVTEAMRRRHQRALILATY